MHSSKASKLAIEEYSEQSVKFKSCIGVSSRITITPRIPDVILCKP